MLWIIFLSFAQGAFELSTIYYSNNDCVSGQVYKVYTIGVGGCSDSPCSGGIEQKCTAPNAYSPPDPTYFTQQLSYTDCYASNAWLYTFWLRDRYCMTFDGGVTYFKASCGYSTVQYENFTDSSCGGTPFSSVSHITWGCENSTKTYSCGASATQPPTTSTPATFLTWTWATYTTTPALATRNAMTILLFVLFMVL